MFPTLNLTIEFWMMNFIFQQLPQFSMTYRKLLILSDLYNISYSTHVTGLLTFAFPNQVSVNYGTLCLYSSLPFGSWLGCLYLSLSGAFNLSQLQVLLASPFEVSQTVFESWDKIPGGNRKEISSMKRFRKYYRKRYPLRVKRGNFGIFRKESSIEWLDSLIDKTVSLILIK